jgi:hypothetical protein
MTKYSIVIAAAIATTAIVSTTPLLVGHADAKSASVFQRLNGTWRGSGRINLANGRARRISCRAYYNVKNKGQNLGLAIRCASSDSKIELLARLRETNGKISGTWEERTFNAAGNVYGAARNGRLNLSIDGSVSGTMNISFSKRRQRVSIKTATQELRGIAINLRR